MTFLDTSTLVGALLEKHPQHAACLRALQEAAKAAGIELSVEDGAVYVSA